VKMTGFCVDRKASIPIQRSFSIPRYFYGRVSTLLADLILLATEKSYRANAEEELFVSCHGNPW